MAAQVSSMIMPSASFLVIKPLYHCDCSIYLGEPSIFTSLDVESCQTRTWLAMPKAERLSRMVAAVVKSNKKFCGGIHSPLFSF
jgi:hypothetical protein